MANPIARKIGKYLTSLIKKKGGKAADEVDPYAKVADDVDPEAAPQPDPEAEPVVEPTPEPELEPDIEPEGPPQIAPEGAPDTSLNVPRAMELVEDMRETPRPGISDEGRPDDGNMNLQMMKDDPRVAQIADLVNEGQERFQNSPSRRRVSLEESVEASEDVRVLARAINKPWDSSWSHEEILALGQLNKDVTLLLKEKADEMIINIDAGQVSGSEEIAFAYLENQAIMVQQKMTDAAAASGRSLQAFKKIQDATNSMEYQQAQRELIEMQGGSEALRERIRMYAQGKTLEDIYKAKNQGGWSKAKNLIMQVRYNMMLSSIRTHVANITGSGFFTAYENLGIRPLQTVFNKIEQGVRMIPGMPAMKPEEVMYLRENWAATNSFMEGMAMAGSKAWRTFLGKEKDVGPTKMSVEGPGRMSQATVPTNTAGKVLTTPTRALEAEDVAFRTLNAHAELSRLAYREARNMAENSKDAQQLFNEFMEHPPEHLRKQAQEFGEKSTFINDPHYESRLLANIATNLSKLQQDNMVIQMVVPFVRTPANLMIYAKNNLGMSSRLVTDYFSGGAIKRAEWNARLTGATGFFMLAGNLYDKGLMTGVGNPNQSIRTAEQKTGANPSNSFKYNGEWMQLNRLDPFGLMLGIATSAHEYADYYEGDKNASLDMIVPTLLSISELMLDRSMLSGLSQVMETMQGDTGAAKTGDVAGTLALVPSLVTPGFLRDARMAADPIMRDMEPEGMSVKGIAQRIQKRWMNAIPWLSNQLPPKRDWRGNIKEYQGNAFYRALVPVPITKPMEDKGSAAIIQYGVPISKVNAKFIIPKTGIPLNTMEIDGGKGFAYNRLQQFIGESRGKYVDKLASSSSFEKTTNKIIVDGVVVDQFMYEAVSEKISKAMSLGRQEGIHNFLKWIDGKTEIPGPNGKMIPVDHVVNRSDYIEFTKAYRAGEELESDLYSIPKRKISPGAEDSVSF